MPIDQSTQPAAGTTRRTFLVRSAVGGALVTAGAVAAPVLGLTNGAGAQSGDEKLTDTEFASFATPFEMAAVLGYQAALNGGALDTTWAEWARRFQQHHQDTASLLASLVTTGPTPRADAGLTDQVTGAITLAGTDQTAVLAVLASVEETLAATHLSAIPVLRDPITARTVAQVVATESQQAALLGVESGASFEEMTPAESTTDAAVDVDISAIQDAATTTTAAN